MSRKSKAKRRVASRNTSGKPSAPPPVTAGGQRKTNTYASKLALSFTHSVAAMMRDVQYRNLPIAVIEWLVMPPLLVGQFRIAHTKTSEQGPFVPTAVALWASVSPLVDKRLSEALDQSPRLSAADWTSGSIKWLIVLAGEKRVLPRFLQQLRESDFKGQTIKVRVQDTNGKPVVRTLSPPIEVAIQT